MMDDMALRFSEIKWHNLALLSFRTERRVDVDDIALEVIGLYSDIGRKFEILFRDATYLSTTIDFAAKRSCSDALDGARCLTVSPWKQAIINSNPYDGFASYLHFEIGLVPKGGLINILAADFEVRDI